MAKKKKASFMNRVINIPSELNSFVTGAIMAGFLWLEVYLTELLKFDLDGWVVGVGAALASLLTFAVKAALERWVPEQFHGVVNSVLAWLATFVGGVAVLNFLG